MPRTTESYPSSKADNVKPSFERMATTNSMLGLFSLTTVTGPYGPLNCNEQAAVHLAWILKCSVNTFINIYQL